MEESMEHGMMMTLGVPVFGVDLYIWLLLASGIFYLICALVIWKPFRKEGNELIHALFAFFIYQAINMFFMGIEIQTRNMLYSNIAALSIFIGSAYMLKFPFSRLSKGTRNIIFLSTLVILLGLFAWFMMKPDRQMDLMHFVMWYDIVINGIIVGGSIIIFAIMTAEKVRRRKAVAGGAGVMACCIVANATMISGALITSAIFQFLAPIIILASIRFPKKKEGISSSNNPVVA